MQMSASGSEVDVQVEVTRVAIEDRSILSNLLELYCYDVSEVAGWTVNDHGLFGYRDLYWTDPDRISFLIRVGGKLAGFVLMRIRRRGDGAPESSITEFFVMRTYRRQGVGGAAARQIFDLFPGDWKVVQLNKNVAARSFWRQVIAEYIGGSFTETVTADSRATFQRFSVRAR